MHAVTESLRYVPRICVAELIPGEVDTGMQADLREPDAEVFPLASFFRGNRDNLMPAAVAAQFCYWVLTVTTPEAFSCSEPWFFYDRADQPRWVAEDIAFPYTAP